MWVVGSAM